jgi:hypothetical protein
MYYVLIRHGQEVKRYVFSHSGLFSIKNVCNKNHYFRLNIVVVMLIIAFDYLFSFKSGSTVFLASSETNLR